MPYADFQPSTDATRINRQILENVDFGTSMMERAARHASLLQDITHRRQRFVQDTILSDQKIQENRLVLARMEGEQKVFAAQSRAQVAEADGKYDAAQAAASELENNSRLLTQAATDLAPTLERINRATTPEEFQHAAADFHGRYSHLARDPRLAPHYAALDGQVAGRLAARGEAHQTKIRAAVASLLPALDPSDPDSLARIRSSPSYLLARQSPDFARIFDDAQRQAAPYSQSRTPAQLVPTPAPASPASPAPGEAQPSPAPGPDADLASSPPPTDEPSAPPAAPAPAASTASPTNSKDSQPPPPEKSNWTEEDRMRAAAAKLVYKTDDGGLLEKLGINYTDEFKDKGGFQAALYRNEKTGQYYLSFRGTEGAKILSGEAGDWVDDFKQGTSLKADQYELAVALAKKVQAKLGDNVVVVGHSLGGGLASAAAYATGLDATTYNSAGLSKTYLRGKPGKIRAHFIDGEVLSAFQDKTFAPDAVGERILHRLPGRIPALMSYLSPPLAIARGVQSVKRHFMDNFFDL